jgi:hypothetical protein
MIEPIVAVMNVDLAILLRILVINAIIKTMEVNLKNIL